MCVKTQKSDIVDRPIALGKKAVLYLRFHQPWDHKRRMIPYHIDSPSIQGIYLL